MPFLMSQLLPKLNANNNSHFGREMKREGKEETVSNLITWLHIEASVRSRGKNNTVSEDRNESRPYRTPRKTENNAPSGIIQATAGNQTAQHATNAEKTITVLFTMTRLAKRAQIHLQEHLLSNSVPGPL